MTRRLLALVAAALFAAVTGTPSDARHHAKPQADQHAVVYGGAAEPARRAVKLRAVKQAKKWKRHTATRKAKLAAKARAAPARRAARLQLASADPHDMPAVTQWGAPARFINGALQCAANVNAELARRGIAGTGSRLAKDFLHWGRPSGPVPGAVAIYNRTRNPRLGHAALVDHVRPDGKVVVWNPSHRRGWVRTVYGKRAVAYRVAG